MVDWFAVWLPRLWLLLLACLSVWGWLGLTTLVLWLRYRRAAPPAPPAPAEWPRVTVQLPLYNEQDVARRVIDAAAQLDYPAGRLQIQVLDDSADCTTGHARAAVAAWQAAGVRIVLLHRRDREGFKAGALQAALASADGELIAVFDADFIPPADFLRQTVPWLAADPRLAAVQARWEHLNPHHSVLTRAQAIALDKHFVADQFVRFSADLFPKFNGSGGLWRRSAIEEAGGWHDDTLCEDLCLSTRAVLAGWKMRFLPALTAPAELPALLSAYKNQQARWAKGSLQCLLKYAGQMVRTPHQTPFARLYALLVMSGYWTAPLVLLLLLLQLPLVLIGATLPGWVVVFGLAAISQPLLFLLAQVVLRPDWPRRLIGLPLLLGLAIGIAPVLTRALGEVIFGRYLSGHHNFQRTPKGAAQHGRYRPRFDRITLVEAALALYAAGSAAVAVALQRPAFLPLLIGAAISLALTAYTGWREASGDRDRDRV